MLILLQVVTEAAKTGGSAVLLWFNAVVEGAGNSKELERILQRTSKLEAGQPVATPGEYAYRAKSAGTIHKCGVVLQASTQTEAADAILSQAAPAMHVTSLQTLQMAADQAAARLAAMNETLTGSGQVASYPEPAVICMPSNSRTATSIPDVWPAHAKASPVMLSSPVALLQGQVEVERGSQELADFLRDKGLYDACYTRLLREGLTLDVMKAIIAANRELQNFVESLKFAGLSAGHAMVIFAHLSKP